MNKAVQIGTGSMEKRRIYYHFTGEKLLFSFTIKSTLVLLIYLGQMSRLYVGQAQTSRVPIVTI